MSAPKRINPSVCGNCTRQYDRSRCVKCKTSKAASCEAGGCPLAGKDDPMCDGCGGPPHRKRSCHNCPNNGLNLPVCWASCKGPNEHFGTDGENFVTLGSFDDAESFVEINIDKSATDRTDQGDTIADRIDGIEQNKDDGVTTLDIETERALLRLLRLIASMRKPDLIVFHGLLNGMSITEASVESGFTKQNGSFRLLNIIARFPELKPFVNSCKARKDS